MGFFGGSANGTNQKRSNLIHERIIGWKTNGIPKAFFLQILVDAGIGKGGRRGIVYCWVGYIDLGRDIMGI